jgi:hypothetical protein
MSDTIQHWSTSSEAVVVSNTQVRSAAMLILLMVVYKHYESCVICTGMIFIVRFMNMHTLVESLLQGMHVLDNTIILSLL